MPLGLLHSKPEFDVVWFRQIGNGIGKLAGRTKFLVAFSWYQPVADILLCIIAALAVSLSVVASYPVTVCINVAGGNHLGIRQKTNRALAGQALAIGEI